MDPRLFRVQCSPLSAVRGFSVARVYLTLSISPVLLRPVYICNVPIPARPSHTFGFALSSSRAVASVCSPILLTLHETIRSTLHRFQDFLCQFFVHSFTSEKFCLSAQRYGLLSSGLTHTGYSPATFVFILYRMVTLFNVESDIVRLV